MKNSLLHKLTIQETAGGGSLVVWLLVIHPGIRYFLVHQKSI
jgi:hypothetical protein